MNKRIAEFITDLCDEIERTEKHNESLLESYRFQQETIDDLRKKLKESKAKIRAIQHLNKKGLLK